MKKNGKNDKNLFSSILFFNFPNGNSFARVHNYSSMDLTVCIVLLFNHLIRFTIDTPLTVETDESEYYKRILQQCLTIWLHCVISSSVHSLKVHFVIRWWFRYGLNYILNIVVRIVKWFEVHEGKKIEKEEKKKRKKYSRHWQRLWMWKMEKVSFNRWRNAACFYTNWPNHLQTAPKKKRAIMLIFLSLLFFNYCKKRRNNDIIKKGHKQSTQIKKYGKYEA